MPNKVRRALGEWGRRLWGTWRPRRGDAELEEELRLHLELAAEHARHTGAPDQQARRVATLRHGAVEQSMEAVRDQRGFPWLGDLARDVRHGLRSLARTPMFAAAVLLTLAIGIGATTAIFSVVNSVLLKPLAYPHAEQLIAVTLAAPGAPGLASVSGDLRLSGSMYFTYAEQNQTFQAIGLWTTRPSTVTGLAEPEQVRTVLVTDGTLPALAVQPLVGRWLGPADQVPGGPQTVMLGYGYWQRRFGGDASVIGRTINIDSRPREIVGVMPEGFRIVTADLDVVLPLALDRGRQLLPGFGFQSVARLKPGATLAQASADIARMVPIWMSSWPAAATVDPRIYEAWQIAPALRALKQEVVGNVASALWVMMGTIGIVMLIACANVASLLLVRTEARQQELAVRAALGAGRARIVRGLLIESVLLGCLGGALGVVLAYVGLRFLVAAGPSTLPRLAEIGIDARVLAFALAVSVCSGILFGLIPTLRYAGPGIAQRLRAVGRTASGSRERSRARDLLVVTQIALALVLLVSSGLMIRTFQALRAVEPGFRRPEHVQTLQIAIPPSLVPDPFVAARQQHNIVDALTGIPGVVSAGFASVLPMEPVTPDWDVVSPEGQPFSAQELPPLRLFKSVSPGLFGTLGTRLVAGRDFDWTDLYERRPGVLLSEGLARELWGTAEAALGKRLRTLPTAPWREVIGVVQDVRDNGVHEPAAATVYWPSLGENYYRAGQVTIERVVTIAVRSERAGTESLMQQIRQAVWSVNGSVSVAGERTMQELYDRSMARTSFTLVLLAIAGAMALLLGIVGVYGVISYAVSQRTREIGIRLALGAQGGELQGMFLRHGLLLAGAGTIIGLAAAAALTRSMSSLLFEVSPLDPVTYLAVPVVLVAATMLASYLPARRAAAMDPVEALKTE